MKKITDYSFGVQLFIWSLRREVMHFKNESDDCEIVAKSLELAKVPEVYGLMRELIYAMAVSAKTSIDVYSVCVSHLSQHESIFIDALLNAKSDALEDLLHITGVRHAKRVITYIATCMQKAGFILREKQQIERDFQMLLKKDCTETKKRQPYDGLFPRYPNNMSIGELFNGSISMLVH